MKSKPSKQQDPELERDDDGGVEVDSSGPAIAAAKKSKMAIIAASSILITVVIYIFFFTGSEKPKEKLEVVETPKPSSVAPSDSGKSPFEMEKPDHKTKEDVELLAKPAVPDVPTLPDLPKDAALPELDLTKQNQQQKTESPLEKLVLPALPQPDNKPQNQQPHEVGQAQQVPQAAAQEEKKPVDPRYAPIVVFSGAVEGTGPARSVGYDNNIVELKKNPLDDLKETKSTVVPTYISDRTHTIAQGKLLTAILETAINTELPGLVRAVVSRDVYGESGNEILIPKGSRLFGSYSSEIKRGQGRVQIGWTRLIRTDGVDLAIGFNASDQFGRAGLPGEVDNKYNSIITSSLLTSVLAVGGVAAAQRLLTNNSATTTTTNPTQGTTTTTGSATNQALYDVTKTIIDTVGQIISSAIDINPVIRVPQGARITVIVNSDITVPYLTKKK